MTPVLPGPLARNRFPCESAAHPFRPFPYGPAPAIVPVCYEITTAL